MADVLAAIRADLEAVESDASLLREPAFHLRAGAVDRLEIAVLDRIDGLLDGGGPPDALLALRRRAEAVLRRLEEVDDRLFHRLRERVRTGGCAGADLRRLLEEHAGPGLRRDEAGYDALDALVNGLLLSGPLPEETLAAHPEMVYYQQTPARIVLELVERARLGPEDVLVDLGSGLGQVAALASLLSGATARGIEIEPAFAAYAARCAADLGLARVSFVAADARHADLSGGTVYFLYTPFSGGVLRAVLERLRAEARGRAIRLFTYGPCTAEVAREAWLRSEGDDGVDPYRLAGFASRAAGTSGR